MDTTREKLKKHLATLESLTSSGGGLRLGAGGGGGGVNNTLTAGWETEARLIRRVVSEAGDPVERLRDFQQRTEEFRDRYPERQGWTDQQGVSWNAALVLKAIDNLLEHVENWNSADEPFEEEEEYEEEDEEDHEEDG
jgi:hypothetical protein